MTSEQAKKSLTLIAVVSAILGSIWAYALYGCLLDPRSWNVVGLVFILLVGIYAAVVAVANRKRSAQE